MPDPISPADVRPLPDETAAQPEPAPSSGSVLQDLYDRVAGLLDTTAPAPPSCSAPPGGPTQAQLAALLDAFREARGGGVYALLESRPELRAAVGRLSPEELECALVARDPSAGSRSLLDIWPGDAQRVVRITSDYFDAHVHSLTVLEGQAAARTALSELAGLEADLPALVAELHAAEPGSPEAELATLLGLEGDAGDLERVQERLSQTRADIEEFARRLPGHTWTQNDFPAASARALETIGLGDAPRGSIADLTAREVPGRVESALSGVLEFTYDNFVDDTTGNPLEVLGKKELQMPFTRNPLLRTITAFIKIEAMINHENVESHGVFVRTGRALGM